MTEAELVHLARIQDLERENDTLAQQHLRANAERDAALAEVAALRQRLQLAETDLKPPRRSSDAAAHRSMESGNLGADVEAAISSSHSELLSILQHQHRALLSSIRCLHESTASVPSTLSGVVASSSGSAATVMANLQRLSTGALKETDEEKVAIAP